jgi:hypothetical protein
MIDHNNTPDLNKHNEISKPQSQLQTIFQYLLTNVATASMVSESTGIPQKNITRYKRDLELNNMLWEIEKKICQKTGFKAWYLTTDKSKVTNCSTQFKINL